MQAARAMNKQKVVRLGAYDITGFIAQGGMGSVFEARHRITGEQRALKVIRPDLARDRAFVERFMREVKLAASIRHPNLVEVFEPGMEGDAVFLPMELLRGETLASLLGRAGALMPVDVATLMISICRGVYAIHRRGILHRDLKPLNIFLALLEAHAITPKVLDFGTAREVQDTEHTAAGIVVGSPYYMAPEQAAGVKDLDAGADQYALAAIAYHALTGRRVHEADNHAQVLSKLLRQQPYPDVRELNREVPEGMAAAIRRGLSHDRAERFPNVAAFGMALAAPLAAFLGNPSAVRALSGRELDLMVTVPQSVDGRLPAMTAEQAQEASDILADLDSSCIISIRPSESQSEPLREQDGTQILESLDESCVVEVDGVAKAPRGGGTEILDDVEEVDAVPLTARRSGASTVMTARRADDDSIVLPRKSVAVVAVVGLAVAALLGVAAAVWLFVRAGSETTPPPEAARPGDDEPAAAPDAPAPVEPPTPPAAPPVAATPTPPIAAPAPAATAPAVPAPAVPAPAAPAPAAPAPAQTARRDREPPRATERRRDPAPAPEVRAVAPPEPRPPVQTPPAPAPALDVDAPCVPRAGIPCM